ncbi:MAG: thermonuclease family protein [Myxococcales bacterium]|nr:MAG: thermonuclease family protein [Myxococcales bacterium]
MATDGNIKFKVRLAAMDAPERGQPYSKVAKHLLSEYVLDESILIRPVGSGLDRYGRVLGHVSVNNKDVALRLIEEGLASYYRPTCQDYPADKKKYNYEPALYVQAEQQARQKKRNMWSEASVILACSYRRQPKHP